MSIYKTRDIAAIVSGESYLTFDQGASKPYGSTYHSAQYGGHQEVLTENHPGFLAGVGGDQGGPFLSRKTEVAIESERVSLGSSYYGYEGQLTISGFGSSSGRFELFPVSQQNVDSVDRLFALGGTAISRSIPTNPVGGAATFLGELREGVPAIIGSSFRARAKEALKAQKAGNEYLNVEFGWKPLVADLRKFARGVKNQDRILTQLSRDSGRNVRRSYYFPAEETSEVDIFHRDYVLGQADGTNLNTYLYAGPGEIIRTTKTSTRSYFKGCFTYHLPDYNEVFGVKRYLAEADKLLGVKPTPEVIWNLAPWSWAADWFANTGDVMNNLTQFTQNDLAMSYGYMMQHRYATVQHLGFQTLNTWQGPKQFQVAYKHHAGAMTRVPASPFGFGFTFSDFNPRQLAIASALGITRVR